MYSEIIIKTIKKVTGAKEVNLDVPERQDFGDYSTNIALHEAKDKDKSPKEYAQDLVNKFQKDEELTKMIDKIEIAGPGFINFWLKEETLFNLLTNINSQKDAFGKLDVKRGVKVVVEYTDPNPFKEFHIGHLISNTTGEAFSRLQEAVGAEVRRVDYFGDVGVHVGKSIWGIRQKMQEGKITLNDLARMDLKERIKFMGQGYALGSTKYDEEGKAKEEIDHLNTVLYLVAQKMWTQEGKKAIIDYDPKGKIPPDEVEEVYNLYVQGRKWSLEYFETIYKRLGTKFDNYYPESMVAETGYKYIIDNLGKVFEKSEGAIIFRGEKFGLHTRVFVNKHNLPTYEAKELGLAPAKYSDFAYDESIIVVGKEIKEYFNVLKEALTQINPKLGEATKPIFTGMVNVPGGKMGSRFGNVITVTGLIEELKRMVLTRMREEYSENEKEEIAEKVGIGAIKYAFLKTSVGQDIIFDLGKSLSLEGDSGPYLQYTFARCQSVLIKAKRAENSKQLKVNNLNTEELVLLRTFIHFPETIGMAAKNYSPNLICSYLFDLAQKYNNFYNQDKIIGSENQSLRLKLTEATGQILKNGLQLLGIKTPERM